MVRHQLHLGKTWGPLISEGPQSPAVDLLGLFAYYFHWSEREVNNPSVRKNLRTHLVQLSTR